MFHIAMYEATAGGMGGAVTDFDMPAVNDTFLTLSSGHFILPQPLTLIGATVLGSTTVTRVKVRSPKIRAFSDLEVDFFDILTAPTAPYQWWYSRDGIKLPQVEEVQMLLTDSAGATDVQGYTWYGDGDYTCPPGEIYTVRWTWGGTGVADAWAGGSVTLTSVLPPGRYAIVGQHAIGTNLLAARIRFPGVQMLPGNICSAAATTKHDYPFRMGKLGKWGEFESYAPPTVEVTGSAGTPSAITGWWDLIRVRGPAGF